MGRVRVYEKKTEKIYIAEIDRINRIAIVIRNGKRDEMTLVDERQL